MRNIFIGAATIAALTCSAALFAATNDNTVHRSVEVHYTDMNANTADGARALYARLRSAAKAACGTAPGSDLASRSDFNACRSEALSVAVAKVGSRNLTALHRSSVSPLELARFDDAVKSR
ncbi:MAG: UrcA family protein [Steroidobacteraceae bacterium]